VNQFRARTAPRPLPPRRNPVTYRNFSRVLDHANFDVVDRPCRGRRDRVVIIVDSARSLCSASKRARRKGVRPDRNALRIALFACWLRLDSTGAVVAARNHSTRERNSDFDASFESSYSPSTWHSDR